MYTYQVLSRIPDFVPILAECCSAAFAGSPIAAKMSPKPKPQENTMMQKSGACNEHSEISFTFWKAVFLAIMAAGVYATWIRFRHGLGASTNLSDQFPWGIWIGFDVMCGVMLAAGGFTLTAAVEIFNIKRLHSILRPTILTAFLGYLLVCAALMFDLGLPWNIWHPLVMRNPHSVMFEVAYCVMLYTTVLALEFSPIVLERFGWHEASEDRAQRVSSPLVILGVILSTLAPVIAGHAVPHHAEQASPLLVQPAAAGVLLPLGDCGRFGDDDLRVLAELQVLRRKSSFRSCKTRPCAGGGALGVRHPSVRRPVSSRRAASWSSCPATRCDSSCWRFAVCVFPLVLLASKGS